MIGNCPDYCNPQFHYDPHLQTKWKFEISTIIIIIIIIIIKKADKQQINSKITSEKQTRYLLQKSQKWILSQNSNLQIGVRGRLLVRVLSSEHAHFEKFRPPNLNRVLSMENSYS